MAKEKSTALATQQPAGLAKNEEQAAIAAAFANFNFGENATGLEEVDSEDLRFAVKVWNMSAQKPNSEDFFRVNEFFDTLTENTQKELNCVLVNLHKTNDYSFRDKSTEETVRVCSSYDRVTGRLRVVHPVTQQAEGTVRECATCPDSKWETDADGKPNRRCGPIYNAFGVELDEESEPSAAFMIRFKRTSLKPFKTHLQKHHIKRFKLPNGRLVDMPLYAFQLRITLKADVKGKFAIPVIERGAVLSNERITEMEMQCRNFLEMAPDALALADKKETEHKTDGAIDTEGSSESFKPSDFNG